MTAKRKEYTQQCLETSLKNDHDKYEKVNFVGVDFYKITNGNRKISFSQCSFIECSFENCDLSLFDCEHCTFKDVSFCDTDFNAVDISTCYYQDCYFERANMANCVLVNNGFVANFNYGSMDHFEDAQLPDIIPSIPNIHQAVYKAATETDISLNMGNWHTCKTTHCIAGWVVHLAGEPGYALEKFFQTDKTAQFIYWKSDPNMCIETMPYFYGNNDESRSYLKHLATYN